MRSNTSTNAPVYTISLIFIAINVAVISCFLTLHEVDVSVKPAADWALRRIYNIGVIKQTVDTIRNSIGLPELNLKPFTRRANKHETLKPDQLESILSNSNDLPVFTKEQLALFDGSRQSKPVYLAILGRIYDVQKGRKHYAPGGGYHFFAGKDATRAFVTGDFSDSGLSDDLTDLSEQEFLSVLDWVKFYEKDYKAVGVVEGLYYDSSGKPTSVLNSVKEQLEKAVMWKEKQLEENQVFPPCNSEWSKDSGGRIWCTAKSGGVSREWAGVPRRLFNPASKSYRCACVKNFGAPLATPGVDGNRGDLDNPGLREYDNCSPTANSCKLSSN